MYDMVSSIKWNWQATHKIWVVLAIVCPDHNTFSLNLTLKSDVRQIVAEQIKPNYSKKNQDGVP